MKYQLILLVALFGAALCSKHTFTGPRPEYFWEKLGKVDGAQVHTITFGVKLKDNAPEDCGSLLETVSDPNSPSYGQFLSLEEVTNLFSDHKSTKAVEKWLDRHDIAYETTITGDFIVASAKISKLENLLDAEYYHWQAKVGDSEKNIRRTETFSLPKHIAKHVDFVSGTVRFPPMKSLILSPINHERQAQGYIYPALLSKVYNVDSNSVASKLANQSVFEALGQSYSPSDLSSFQSQYSVPNQPIAQVIGPNSPNDCSANPNNCAEANLDVQYIIAVAQGSPTTFWSIDPNSQDPFVDWVVAVSGTAYPPLVHSMSYGSIAKEDDTHDMTRFNTEVCKLGLRGVTVIISSGDDGVANFVARTDASQCGFSPSFPANSPYATAVGATQGLESGKPEIACSSSTGGVITTGGGFSFFFPRPSYQNAATTQYLQTAPNLPPSNLFNAQGRGYPDVAMAGYNYVVAIGGQYYELSGTSASAPVFAGMITLINGARISTGKSPLGFLNPALYNLAASNPSIFNDITVGENNCCAYNGTGITCCQYGFNATTGWDPLTGLGSINFVNLKHALLGL